MLTTANGKTVLEATVHLPRVGVWHADLIVDTPNASDVTGAIALSFVDGQLLLSGSSYRPPLVWRGLTRVRMAAGAAGLGTILGRQGYDNSPASVLVGDILAGAGEKLSGTAMSLSTRMAWARFAEQSAGTALQAVVDELGATWRSLPDGTIWIGTETWPASPITDFHVLDQQPEDARLLLATSTPTLLPGTTFTGLQVGRVVYRASGDALRAEVFFE